VVKEVGGVTIHFLLCRTPPQHIKGYRYTEPGEESVSYTQWRMHDVVRAGIHAQVDDSCLDGMLGVGYVQHADLPGLE
jgi:hypothetical protein